MLTSLVEAHQLYLEGILIVPLGEAGFVISGQRIPLFNKVPHSLLVCIYHENVRLLLLGLAKCTGTPSSTFAFYKFHCL